MTGPYRDGKVHVRAELCKTCIFRPGNLMRLAPGRVEGMVEESLADDTAITCHSTLDTGREAVCRGFWNHHRTDTLPLRLAVVTGLWEADSD